MGLRRACARVEPELDSDPVNREPDPEGDPEKLMRREMGDAAGGEEDAHHRTRGRDAEEDDDGACEPSPPERLLTAGAIVPGADERDKEESIEEEDGAALGPAANDGVHVHGIGGDGDDDAERKKPALRPGERGEAAQHGEGQHEDKGERGNDMGERECRVRSEEVVESRELRRAGGRGMGEGDETAQHRGDGDDDADPEANAQEERGRRIGGERGRDLAGLAGGGGFGDEYPPGGMERGWLPVSW